MKNFILGFTLVFEISAFALYKESESSQNIFETPKNISDVKILSKN